MEALTRLAHNDAGDLVASAAAGDEVAFRRIIAAYHDDMRRVCVYVTGDLTTADEATQAAWSIAWKKIGTVREPAGLRPWLMAVAVNEARQLLRKRRRRAEVEVRTDGSVDLGGMDPSVDVRGLDLRRALARLDPEDRALLAMRYGAGFNSNELAAATGISPSGTRSRIERLLKRLREDLGDG
jgi:RNA polymerase sigma-70 factor (ECF subfamily)